jgi:hypothetical protein
MSAVQVHQAAMATRAVSVLVENVGVNVGMLVVVGAGGVGRVPHQVSNLLLRRADGTPHGLARTMAAGRPTERGTLLATADDNHSRVSAEHRHRLGPTRATPVAGTTCLVRLRPRRCLDQARSPTTRAASRLAGPRYRKARARGSPKEKAKARVGGQPTPAVRRMGTGCRAEAGAHVAITRRGIDET